MCEYIDPHRAVWDQQLGMFLFHSWGRQVPKSQVTWSRENNKQVAPAKSCTLDLTSYPTHWKSHGPLCPIELDKTIRHYRNMNKVMVLTVINQDHGSLSVDVWGFYDNMMAYRRNHSIYIFLWTAWLASDKHNCQEILSYSYLQYFWWKADNLVPVILLIHSRVFCKIIEYLKLEGTHKDQVLSLAGLPKSKSISKSIIRLLFDRYSTMTTSLGSLFQWLTNYSVKKLFLVFNLRHDTALFLFPMFYCWSHWERRPAPSSPLLPLLWML